MGQVKQTTVVVGALLLLFLGCPPPALAAPLYDSRNGGLALIGPASAHPASFLYNPAALALGEGRIFQALMDGTVRLAHGSIQRRSIDVTSGRPSATGSTRAFDEEDLLETMPFGLLALSSNLGSRSVVLCLAGHTSTGQRYSFLREDGDTWFDGATQGPTRYAATDLTLYHVHGTLAASVKVIEQLMLGVSASLVWGHLDFGFVRDAALEGGTTRDPGEVLALDDCGSAGPCNYESDDAAEAMRIRGSAWGFNVAAGVVVRPHRSVDVGLAYVSRVFGVDGGEMVAKGDAWVRRSRAGLQNALGELPIDEVERDLTGRGTVSYVLPDTVNLGVSWRTTPRILLNLQLRWTDYSAHERLKLRFSGSMFRKPPDVPERIDHYRGFNDVYAIQLGGAYLLTEAIQLQAAAMVETSAVSSEAVTPVVIDATKLDLLLGLTWRLGRYFTLRAGYSLVWFPAVDEQESQLDPSAMVSCVDAYYDIDLRDCKVTAEGRGMPSAAGTYALLTHRLGTSLAFHLP